MTGVEHTTKSITGGHRTRGFALPTILISSIVMLMVLLVSVSSTTAVRTAIKNQYYTQLAKVAGEAGIMYAEACLDNSAGVPTWSNAQPLKPNTDCSGVNTVDCSVSPSDALCSVTRNGNIRSNFSIGMPPVYANGKAKTLPNTGFVEILRTSNGAAWRRYEQKAAPTVAVPDLCSGSATAALGWNNAVAATANVAFPEPLATTIGITNVAVNPGPTYFRKDFNVTKAGTYTVQIKADNYGETSIDGRALSPVTPYPAIGTASVDLAVGCHSLTAKVTNGSVLPTSGVLSNFAGMTLSLQRDGASAPIMVSDTTWRVSAGTPIHYSSVNYYTDTNYYGTADTAYGWWAAARDLGAYNASAAWGTGPVPDWATTSGDASARWISTVNDYSAGNYPVGVALFKDTRVITVAAPTQIKVTYACDNSCDIWLDGVKIVSSDALWNVTQTITLTLSEGSHGFGVALANSAVGPSGFLFSAVRTSDNVVLSRSNTVWVAATFWAATDRNPFSYDDSFTPNPPIERGINIAADFSLWTLSGGATYNASTRILTLSSTGSAVSPKMRVDKPTGIAAGGDFYATTVSPWAAFAPLGGYYLGIAYFESDAITAAYNSAGYTANGCAKSINLSVWTLNDSRCTFAGGSNVRYVTINFSGGTYSSPDLTIKTPLLRLNQ